jgi:hypothetical protein
VFVKRRRREMLRITADVNGAWIGAIYIHNTGKLEGDTYLYNAGIESDGDMTLGIEGVPHVRGKGWMALVQAVLERRKG